MRSTNVDITTQEVPGELCICFTITGCPLKCKGCHSEFLWDSHNGKLLSNEQYTNYLNQYQNLATCVLFMGGEWYEQDLVNKLRIAKARGYKTCLYTGLTRISKEIKQELTWLKTGPWIEKKGGLESPITNQLFIEVKTNKTLNSLFLNKSI
ncbi:anaerobic ribonucleoside-triphosphate reductase activating protein [Reichenbachiella versicolor]|uniref:anaerobic ribonucleoside-triphosphate reductase activating protein n=1 Tax=Reichenbachiella versicolor TaxID=1821036 RepID=UPI000D6DE762|nr:anaerobic ribonucleoside-triphosphate reductase activating protein [Reichenbachiella versicolor]